MLTELWNSLPNSGKSANSLVAFKKRLEDFYFIILVIILELDASSNFVSQFPLYIENN